MASEGLVSQEVPNIWPSKLLIAQPNGLCAGVVRSIEAYRVAVAEHKKALGTNPNLKLFSVGVPAHNKDVIDEFSHDMTFVDNISEVDDGSMVLLGPHGSDKRTLEIARQKGLNLRNTVCPLVTKVLDEVSASTNQGIPTIYVGHKGHAEAEAARGWSNPRLFFLAEGKEEALGFAHELTHEDQDRVVNFANQTTVNADEVKQIGDEVGEVAAGLIRPRVEDACYATRDRQNALRRLAKEGSRVNIVVGDPTSSNSQRLVEVSNDSGVNRTFFVQSVSQLKPEDFYGYVSVGLTAGASTPQKVIDEVVEFFTSRGTQPEDILEADESGIRFASVKVEDYRKSD